MIDHAELMDALDYNQQSGVFTWKTSRPLSHFKNEHSRRVYLARFAGKQAGYCSLYGNGVYYIQIRIRGKLYLAHRLAWFYVNTKWPNGIIDHKDGNGENNAITNLIDTDNIGNGRNCKLSKNNTSGVNGVYFHKQTNKWCAEGHYTEGGVNKKVFLGLFDDINDAKKARVDWQNIQGGFSTRHGN